MRIILILMIINARNDNRKSIAVSAGDLLVIFHSIFLVKYCKTPKTRIVDQFNLSIRFLARQV
jgi:hypothetical protein